MATLGEALFEAKVKYHQARRTLRWLRDRHRFARTRATEEQLAEFPVVAFRHASTLIRDPARAEQDLQHGKVRNLRLAAARLDRLLIRPGEILSFWFTVGAPTRRRGFEDGLELRNRQLLPSVGGGLCQMTNLLYWMALHLDLEIVEHHRHTYDLFPDHERRLPFASGATVLYNYRDLQLRNNLAQPLALRVEVGAEELEGRFLVREPLGFSVEIVETDHGFFRREGRTWRTNRLWRRVRDAGGTVVREGLVARNLCEVLYEVSEEVPEGEAAL